MTPQEAVRKLKKNPRDSEAIKSLITNYEPFIMAMISRYRNGIRGMDDGDVKQDLHLKLIRQIDAINLKMSDPQIDSYIKTVLKNRVIRLVRQSETERGKLQSLDAPIFTSEEGDEVTLEDVLEDTLEPGAIEVLQDSDLVERLMTKISPGAQKVVKVILEGDGKIKRIREELAKDPSNKPSKGAVKRLIRDEIRPALKSLMALN